MLALFQAPGDASLLLSYWWNDFSSGCEVSGVDVAMMMNYLFSLFWKLEKSSDEQTTLAFV